MFNQQFHLTFKINLFWSPKFSISFYFHSVCGELANNFIKISSCYDFLKFYMKKRNCYFEYKYLCSQTVKCHCQHYLQLYLKNALKKLIIYFSFCFVVVLVVVVVVVFAKFHQFKLRRSGHKDIVWVVNIDFASLAWSF